MAVMLRQRKQIGFAKLLEENGGTKAPPYEIRKKQRKDTNKRKVQLRKNKDGRIISSPTKIALQKSRKGTKKQLKLNITKKG